MSTPPKNKSGDNFIGQASSENAKRSYIPISETNDVGNIVLGRNTSSIFATDPKLIGFVAAKQKFVGKMFAGFDRVLEIGCMDGFGSTIVSSFVKNLTSIDFFRPHIEQAEKNHLPHLKNVSFLGADILDGGFTDYDGVYALDVLEHVDPAQQDLFLRSVIASLKPNGVFIVGMPSLEAQVYASTVNKKSHINCQSADQLTQNLKAYFHNVFEFGMNDEVLHTGFGPMCHYLVRLCVGKK